MNTIQTNSYQLETLKEYSKELPKQLELTRKNTKYPMSGIKKGIRDTKKSIGQEELSNGSSMGLLTMEANIRPNCIHPLPITNKRLQEFIDIQSQKSVDEVIKDEFLPSVFHAREIRESTDTPPQVRLQTCQMFINKVIGDKIDITQQKQVVDVNKLLDQLTNLQSIRATNSQNVDNSPVIDVTPLDTDDR